MNIIKTHSNYLDVFALWTIGVGLVISGASFGWNLGWGHVGIRTFFLPFILAGVLYGSLIISLIRLARYFPEAVGPQCFAKSIFGERFGNYVSFLLLSEFLFTIPAIANAISEYIGFLLGNHLYDLWIATSFLLFFCAINFFHVTLKKKFVALLTLLAILELLIFFWAVLPKFKIDALFLGMHEHISLVGLTQALPYAVWMFLAIEGLSLFTRHIDRNHFNRQVSLGYLFSFLTLFLLCSCVLIFSAASVEWTEQSWLFVVQHDHPMPAVMVSALGQKDVIVNIFTFLGLFGLIASLEGTISTEMTQIKNMMEQTRFKSDGSAKFSSIMILIVSVFSIWTSSTGVLIQFSVFGAVTLYFCLSLMLFRLDLKNQPCNLVGCVCNLQNMSLALLSFACMIAFAYCQFQAFLVFAFLTLGFAVYCRLNQSKDV